MSFSCTYPLMNVRISWNGPGVKAGSIEQSVNMDTSTTTSNLAITNVNGSHAGGYFCTAHNISEGMDINSTVAYLVVNCKLYRARKAKGIAVMLWLLLIFFTQM